MYAFQYFPAVWVLMSHKYEDTYKAALKWIKENLFQNLEFESCMSDFEIAISNAVKAIFPGIKIYHCWFHFCQVKQII